jgi:hypothetical protein
MKYGLLLLLFASTLALADSEVTPLTGVWTGTIGKQTITACFNAGMYRKDTGNYYYQRYLHPIDLKSTDIGSGGIGTGWKESNGEWRLLLDKSVARPEAVGGTWTSPDKSRNLPIMLTKVKEFNGEPVNDSWGCENDAYLKAIEPSPKTSFGPEQIINGVTYRKVFVNIDAPGKLCSDSGYRCMETIEIMGNTPSIQAINRQLREISPVSEFASDLLLCWRNFLEGYHNTERVQTADISVIGSYLMLQLGNHSTCVTGRPIEVWEDTYLWNLESGEQEDLFSWFDDEESAQGTLGELVYDQIGDHDFLQCYGNSAHDGYRLELSNSGIRFVMPLLSNGACGHRIAFTFEELWPFLNENGKAAVEKIRKSNSQVTLK